MNELATELPHPIWNLSVLVLSNLLIDIK